MLDVMIRDLYQIWPGALAAEQITAIHDLAMQQPAQPARIFAPDEARDQIRSSSIRWLEADWVRNMLWGYVDRANRGDGIPASDGFNIAVDNGAEIQFTEYHASAQGHYDWHHDVNWNEQGAADRKISVTVQLSPADGYVGGDFEFDEITTNADFRALGTVLVFPSYLRHRVTPVTAGTRQSLVAWFSGPRWR